MHPAANCKTLKIKWTEGRLTVDRVSIPQGMQLEWEGPPGTTAEVVFTGGSPFGEIKTVTQGQRLVVTGREGNYAYQCSLREGDRLITSPAPEPGGWHAAEGDSWGGEVEVTGKGGSRTS
jgi:hypothetical protein